MYCMSCVAIFEWRFGGTQGLLTRRVHHRTQLEVWRQSMHYEEV